MERLFVPRPKLPDMTPPPAVMTSRHYGDELADGQFGRKAEEAVPTRSDKDKGISRGSASRRVDSVKPDRMVSDAFAEGLVRDDDELEDLQLKEFDGEQKPLTFITITDTVDTVGRELVAKGWNVIGGGGTCVSDVARYARKKLAVISTVGDYASSSEPDLLLVQPHESELSFNFLPIIQSRMTVTIVIIAVAASLFLGGGLLGKVSSSVAQAEGVRLSSHTWDHGTFGVPCAGASTAIMIWSGNGSTVVPAWYDPPRLRSTLLNVLGCDFGTSIKCSEYEEKSRRVTKAGAVVKGRALISSEWHNVYETCGFLPEYD